PHAASHHGLPRVAVRKSEHGGLHGCQKRFAGVLGELESGAFLDGIIQPAGGASHGHRAIAQAVHLVEPAGFVVAEHEEDVGSGLDAVRQGAVETDARGDSSGMLLLHEAEEVLELRVAGAQSHQINVYGDDLGGHLGQNVKSLLAGEARNDAEQWPIHGVGGEAEFQQELTLAGGFAGQVGGRITRRDEGVGLRVPIGIIGAVEDAGEDAGAVAQAAIEAEAEFGRLDLAGIGGADGTHGVGELDAGLDVADLAEELHAVGTVDGGVESDFGESGLGEQALVSQVMDGEQGPAAEKGGVGRVSGAQVGGQEAGLPVVAVKDICAKQGEGNAEGGAAEYGKTNVVVRVVQTGFAVEAFSFVEQRAIHQVNG